MSLPNGRTSTLARMSPTQSLGHGGQMGSIAPTCYISSTVTGECYSAPTTLEPLARGLVGSANNAYILPGGVCGVNSQNAHIPCGGNTYCSNFYLGVCTAQNALHAPNVNLNYINYGSRM